MTEQSILAAVSGIEANQTYLNAIGNNIANVDTIGYKAEEVQFQDLLAEQLTGASAPTSGSGGVDPVAIGSGVQVDADELDLSEGTPEQTGQATDVAIQGSGYLVVESGGQQLYTRDGSLTEDANGDLTTLDGGLVQGWEANASGTVDTSAPIGNISIPIGETVGAKATTTFTLGGNLPAWSGTGTPPAAVTTTYNAYDSLGNSIPVTLTFTPVTGEANEWSVQGTVPTADGSGTENLWKTAPTVTFDPTTGQVTGITGVTANADGSFSLPATTMPTDYTSIPSGDTWSFTFPAPDSSGAVTQFAGTASLQIQSQDGQTSGTLTGFSVGDGGTISGTFSNGTTVTLGQIALADFSNPGGLSEEGDGLYATSANSGQALIGTAGTGGRGSLVGGELEQSNVDLGTELTDLISAQEAYEANTKVLTSTDQVIQSLEAVQ